MYRLKRESALLGLILCFFIINATIYAGFCLQADPKDSTSYAPWHILESVDKKYARIKALKIVVEELEKVLG